MNAYADFLEPSSEWLPGLRSGKYALNVASNRVMDAASGKFVAALVPTQGLTEQLSALPLQPHMASQAIASAPELASLQPALSALQLTTSVGALASVATLGVSCVGFALVLNRLKRIDAKLDELLGRVEELKAAVDRISTHNDTLTLARIRTAGEFLDRALEARNISTGQQLAAKARDLFHESKAHHLELWNTAQPWGKLDIPVETALEMQGRYVACAVGEIQAEFLLGDFGTFDHAARSAARDLRKYFAPAPSEAFRQRCDAACERGRPVLSVFGGEMDVIAQGLRNASELTEWTAVRLEAATVDAELVESRGMAPAEFVRLQRGLKGVDVVLVRAA